MATITRRRPSPLFLRVANPAFRRLLLNGKGPTAALMLLAWNGRKTGRSFETPVSRLEVNGTILTATSSGWRHNFAGGHEAELVVDGERRAVTGTAIEDPAEVGRRVRAIIDAIGPTAAQRGLATQFGDVPTPEELADFAAKEGLVLVEFTDRP